MRKRLLGILFFVVLVSSLTFSALAEGGDGSGGGSDVGLSLAQSSVPDGSTGVALDTQIVLTFNKNVVNFAVKDNNMACFTLSNTSGTVPISVIMGDDQIDPDIRRIITVKPNSPLSQDTTYTLTISKNLTSKSGSSLCQDVRIAFTTMSAPASPSPVASPSPIPAASPSPSQSPSAVPTASPTADPSTTAPPAEDNQTDDAVAEAPEKPSSDSLSPSASPLQTSEPDAMASTPELTAVPDEAPAPEMADDANEDSASPVSPLVYIMGAAVVIVITGTIWVVIRKRK